MEQLKLGQLVDVIDYNRDSKVETIQICRFGEDWEDYDEVSTSSAILIPLYPATIKCMEAVDQYIVRVEIDWDSVPFFKEARWRWTDERADFNQSESN